VCHLRRHGRRLFESFPKHLANKRYGQVRPSIVSKPTALVAAVLLCFLFYFDRLVHKDDSLVTVQLSSNGIQFPHRFFNHVLPAHAIVMRQLHCVYWAWAKSQKSKFFLLWSCRTCVYQTVFGFHDNSGKSNEFYVFVSSSRVGIQMRYVWESCQKGQPVHTNLGRCPMWEGHQLASACHEGVQQSTDWFCYPCGIQ